MTTTTAATPTRETFAPLVDAYLNASRRLAAKVRKTDAIKARCNKIYRKTRKREMTIHEQLPFGVMNSKARTAHWTACETLFSAIERAGYKAIKLDGAIYYPPNLSVETSEHPIQPIAADELLDLDAA